MRHYIFSFLGISFFWLVGAWALGQAPSSDFAKYSRSGQEAMAAGKYSEAEADYVKLADLAPSMAEVHATLGVIYFQQGKFEQSVKELRRALALKPGIPKADGLLAMSLSELGQYKEALPGLEKTYHQAVDLPIKRMSGLQLERAYSALQMDRKAIEIALDLERTFINDPEILYYNERIYGNYAYLTVRKLAEVAPSSVWRHMAAGEAQESQGNYVAAIAEYRKVLQLSPNRPGIHYRLGRTFLAKWHGDQQQADLDEAKNEFAVELQLDPNNSNAAYELGEMYRTSGKLDDAKASFQIAVNAHPDFPEALVGLANVLAAQDKWQEGIPLLERAVQLRPDDQVAWYRLSQSYRAIGNLADQKKAQAVFERLRQRKLEERDMSPHEVTQQTLDAVTVPPSPQQ
jgi:tetratricopeptide (TPR) repeat protein